MKDTLKKKPNRAIIYSHTVKANHKPHLVAGKRVIALWEA